MSAVVQADQQSVCARTTIFPEGQRPAGLRVGVYDPAGAFGQAAGIDIEHIFIPWVDFEVDSLDEADRYAVARGRELLITVEPWAWSQESDRPPGNLRDDIMAGRYDDAIVRTCAKFGTLRSPVTARWGHEMDLKNRRYPWSDWRPQDYVAAYRHFSDICRRQAPGVTYMWSPRGEPDLAAFYPGSDYVDKIGLSIFGLQSYDMLVAGRERDFAALLTSSYGFAKVFDKPIYLSEFGCSGDPDYIRRCNDLSEATLSAFPRLQGVIYYSANETGDWPAIYDKPDWTVAPGACAPPR